MKNFQNYLKSLTRTDLLILTEKIKHLIVKKSNKSRYIKLLDQCLAEKMVRECV